jgi:hypothetical protein
MKSNRSNCYIFFLSIIIFSFSFVQKEGPYAPEYLISPADLASIINNPNAKPPVILNPDYALEISEFELHFGNQLVSHAMH